jgi:hypothetical protein
MKLIDKYLPVFQFIERHRLLVTAAPADLLDAVTLAGTIDDPSSRQVEAYDTTDKCSSTHRIQRARWSYCVFYQKTT